MTQDPADTPPDDAGSDEPREAEWGPIAGSSQVPPALRAAPGVPVNGHGVAVPPTAAQQTAQAVAALVRIASQFPQILASMLSPIAQAVSRPQVCADCLAARLAWEHTHMAEIKKAIADATEAQKLAADAAGLAEDDPRRAQLPDLNTVMPEHLRPGSEKGMPPVNPWITMINGKLVCSGHMPGSQAGAKTLLIAHASLTPSLLSQFTG